MTPVSDDWAKKFALEFYLASQTLIFIRPGAQPIQDIQSVIRFGPGQIFWFYYDWDRIPSELWELIDMTYGTRPDLVLNLSNSHALSQRMGFDLDQENLPDLWILTCEVLTLHK